MAASILLLHRAPSSIYPFSPSNHLFSCPISIKPFIYLIPFILTPSIHLLSHPCIYQHICSPIHISIDASSNASNHVFFDIHTSVKTFIYLSINPCILLFSYPSIHTSIHLFFHPYHPPIHPSINPSIYFRILFSRCRCSSRPLCSQDRPRCHRSTDAGANRCCHSGSAATDRGPRHPESLCTPPEDDYADRAGRDPGDAKVIHAKRVACDITS